MNDARSSSGQVRCQVLSPVEAGMLFVTNIHRLEKLLPAGTAPNANTTGHEPCLLIDINSFKSLLTEKAL